jgi:hypothetical protein
MEADATKLTAGATAHILARVVNKKWKFQSKDVHRRDSNAG